VRIASAKKCCAQRPFLGLLVPSVLICTAGRVSRCLRSRSPDTIRDVNGILRGLTTPPVIYGTDIVQTKPFGRCARAVGGHDAPAASTIRPDRRVRCGFIAMRCGDGSRDPSSRAADSNNVTMALSAASTDGNRALRRTGDTECSLSGQQIGSADIPLTARGGRGARPRPPAAQLRLRARLVQPAPARAAHPRVGRTRGYPG
jgi:hypothetical protein